MKQVLVFNSDIVMTIGKLSSQAGHAAIGSYLNANKADSLTWLLEGQKKISLKADLTKIKDLIEEARFAGVAFCLIKDAGETELPPGTVTCLGIGPDNDKVIDKLTGDLKLL